jgi:hypothetical protein
LQAVHAENATELKAIIHRADLELEVVESMIANREPIDSMNKYIFAATFAAKAPYPVCAAREDACF